MRIKHSKYKNTGLIFELLVKQFASDTLAHRDSPAVAILKKFYTGKTSLVKELKLYRYILDNKNISQAKAESIVGVVIETSKKLSNLRKSLNSQKYDLIKEIKEHYDIDEFFSIKINDYKVLAATYCLMEGHNTESIIDPQFLVNNKMTVLEHLTSSKQNEEEVKDTLIEEYSKFDKDLKLLAYKILLKKYNNTYESFTIDQKKFLRQFITEGASQIKLREIVNESLTEIRQQLEILTKQVDNDIVKIKLNEIKKGIQPINKKVKIQEEVLVHILYYYDLINELKKVV